MEMFYVNFTRKISSKVIALYIATRKGHNHERVVLLYTFRVKTISIY